MSIRGLVDLPLVQTSSPLPESTISFYENNIAQGSGPNGTWLMTDFFGTTAGSPHADNLEQINDILAEYTSTLSTLQTCYDRMRTLLTGGYTSGIPPTITITIPSGPGAGTYASYDSALNALIDAANGAVNAAAAAMSADLDTLNSLWYQMVFRTMVYEPANQTRAEIDFATIPAASELSCSAFITTIDGYGQQTEEGQAAFVLQSLAQNNLPGQALQGAMIEGRNEQALDALPLTRWNQVPSEPETPPPQAQLPDASLTVQQARDLVNTRLRTTS